ncbi:MAG: alpha/beta hydrolase family protein, partial [Candidatus Heimdallarchaeota archaeon]
IDHLDNLGMIETEKVGSMGWSQGGYISAFVGIHSKRFKAVSVGAGIADWYTYHISNDIPQFTTHYLSGSPFRDRTLYEKTSPISKIKDAQTPMLIQHGDLDHRVPLANAKELYRGLKEMNVHVELFIYQGMGHPITKPLENRAVVYQNLNWFSHYLLGEKLDLLQKEEDEDKEKK